MGRSACSTRTARYMRRVEAHLPALRDDYARRDFISREMDKWEERYARFIATEGDAHRRGDGADQPSAFDFTETIAALGVVMSHFDEGNLMTKQQRQHALTLCDRILETAAKLQADLQVAKEVIGEEIAASSFPSPLAGEGGEDKRSEVRAG